MHAEFVSRLLKLFTMYRNNAAIDTRGCSVLFVSTLQSQLERCICFKPICCSHQNRALKKKHVNTGACI